MFVSNKKSLWTGTVSDPSPKIGIETVAIVIEILEQNRVFIDGIHFAGHLMMIRFQFANIFTLIDVIIFL